MGISEILHKNNPMQKKIDRENRSDFAKLVDRNTELVDEIKWLKADNDILKSRIDKAIEYIESEVVACAFNNPELEHWEFDDYNMRKLLAILKGEDKE